MWKKAQRILIVLLTFTSLVGLVVSVLSQTQIDVKPALNFLNGTPPRDVLIPRAYISGAINRPGVYEINPDTRIGDMIMLANGLSADVDTNFISEKLNIAKLVGDEDHIFIPVANAVATENAPLSQASNKVNINSATAAQLDELPGVGPSLAEQIIDHRPFSKVEDLQEVPGVGDAKYAQLVDLITI